MLNPLPIALLISTILLGTISRMLTRLNVDQFFLGLSSDFWAGVCIGASIVTTCGLIVLVVKQIIAARPPLQQP